MSAALAPLFFVLFLATLGISLALWHRWRRLAQAQFIRTYRFPPGLLDKLAARRPGLAEKDRYLVMRALRKFFLAYLNGRLEPVSMPSQVVDDLWHEFILYTRHYDAFCKQAFGRFLHHTPAVVLSANRQTNAGLRRVWWHACKEEDIDPRNPARLPLLFAIDAKLGITDGFHYVPDCKALDRDNTGGGSGSPYCGGDFSSTDPDGGTDGFGDSDGGGSDGGGGCGGD
ncbi:MAG: hypothetical protein AB1421_11560 [Pseudomonadota bacterium]